MKQRLGVLLLCLGLGSGLSSSIVAARQDPAPAPAQGTVPLVIRVGVDLIQIDAAITGRDRQPVSDLRVEDFTLEVDGIKQPVSHVTFIDGRPGIAGAKSLEGGAGAPATSSHDRTLVFVVDDLNISFGSMYYARRAMKAFAAGWDPQEAKVGVSFTSDESTTIRLSRSPQRFDEALGTMPYNMRSSKGVSSEPTFFRELAAGPSLTNSQFEADLSPITKNPAMEHGNLQQRVFSLLSTINAMRSVPGRKAVVFVSEGFEISGDRDRLGVDSPFNSLFGATRDDAYRMVRLITEVANRASVVIYTINPSGLVSGMPGADVASAPSMGDMQAAWVSRVGTQGTLLQLSADTGGLSVYNRNDLKGGMRDVVEDQRAYYLVGFEPPKTAFAKDPTKAKFHSIKLRVNRKDVRVRTRAGFYGVTDKEVIERAPLVVSPES
jgi:VWFA-related protein